MTRPAGRNELGTVERTGLGLNRSARYFEPWGIFEFTFQIEEGIPAQTPNYPCQGGTGSLEKKGFYSESGLFIGAEKIPSLSRNSGEK